MTVRVTVDCGAVVVTAVMPQHEQADEYLSGGEHAEA